MRLRASYGYHTPETSSYDKNPLYVNDLPIRLSHVSLTPCIPTFNESKFEMSSILKTYHANSTFPIKTELLQGTLILLRKINDASSHNSSLRLCIVRLPTIRMVPSHNFEVLQRANAPFWRGAGCQLRRML